MLLPDGRTYRPESSVYREEDSMTDAEYFRSSYERRRPEPEPDSGGGSVPCPEDFERNVNISDCTSFLDTQRMDRDKIEESLSLVGFLFTLFSLVIFVLDTGSDFALAYFLFSSSDAEERGRWLPATLVILISSALIVNFLSLKWYVAQQQQPPPYHSVPRCAARERRAVRRRHKRSSSVITPRIPFLLPCVPCSRSLPPPPPPPLVSNNVSVPHDDPTGCCKSAAARRQRSTCR